MNPFLRIATVPALVALLGLALLPNLVGCTPNRQGSPVGASETAKAAVDPESPKTSVPTTQAPVSGTGDPGGGNGINGKVFESYLVDVTKLEEWKTYIDPIDQKLELALKDALVRMVYSPSVGTLKVSASVFKWYLVPVTLDQIPKERIGTDFIKDPIQQLALQKGTEIWINKNLYDSSSPADRARLLVHEMVLWQYRSQFMKQPDICRIFNADSSGGCSSSYFEYTDRFVPPRTSRSLESGDYEKIRTMTQWLFEKHHSLTTENYFEAIERFGFDDRPVASRLLTLQMRKNGSGPSQIDPTDKQPTATEVIDLLNRNKALGAFPMSCGKSLSGGLTDKCDFELNLEPYPNYSFAHSIGANLVRMKVKQTSGTVSSEIEYLFMIGHSRLDYFRDLDGHLIPVTTIFLDNFVPYGAHYGDFVPIAMIEVKHNFASEIRRMDIETVVIDPVYVTRVLSENEGKCTRLESEGPPLQNESPLLASRRKGSAYWPIDRVFGRSTQYGDCK